MTFALSSALGAKGHSRESSGPLVTVRAGFIPLIDCAMLVVARELGFAEAEGIDLQIEREMSWATVRDKMAVGNLDVVHMLAPLAIACNLGLGPLRTRVLAPIALGLGGNTITFSSEVAAELEKCGFEPGTPPAAAAQAFARAVAARKASGRPPFVLGIVHVYSSHFYETAYWMASAGLVPGRDIDIVVLPPSLMPEALANGHVDGFCAGEPWGSIAAAKGDSVIAVRKAAIWGAGPEKVLGISEAFSQRHPEAVPALIRALYKAAVWCDAPDNRDRLAQLLAEDRFLALPQQTLLQALGGTAPVGNFRFAEAAATFPWRSHALWYYSQMVRWGHTAYSAEGAEAARLTYRPDLYRAALADLNVPMPGADSKIEGALSRPTPAGSAHGRLILGPDLFFDGRMFDPDKLEAYIASFPVHA